VVAVLATLAGLTATIATTYQQDAETKLAEVEMARIASAIQRFRADTGHYPLTGPFAPAALTDPTPAEWAEATGPAGQAWLDRIRAAPTNLGWLFTPPVWPPLAVTGPDTRYEPRALMPWDRDAARGWHGPYLEVSGGRSVIPASAEPGNRRRCEALTSAAIDGLISGDGASPAGLTQRMTGVTDPFEQQTRRRPASRFCEVRRDPDGGGYRVPEAGGSPYRYETAFWHPDHPTCSAPETRCIVLRSLGADGRDDGGAGDDLIVILKRNRG
jgi:type II secretory pathway pseudopilin PulG